MEDLLTAALEELSESGDTLLSRANEEDRQLVQDTLKSAGRLYIESLRIGRDVSNDMRHVEATLKDVALKYELAARDEIMEFIKRFSGRLAIWFLNRYIPVNA